MATFEWIARGPEGKTVKGTHDAETEDQVLRYLSTQEFTPISVRKTRGSILNKKFDFALSRVRPEEIYDFTRQLAVMLKAGVPIHESLLALQEQTESQKLKQVISDAADNISEGKSFSESLAGYPDVFSPMVVNMVRAGESAGVVDDVLTRLASFINHDIKVRRDVKKAIRYPIIVLTGVFLAAVGAITFVLPQFSGLYGRSNVRLPLPTRFLLGISDFIQNYWLIVFLGTGLIVLALSWYVRTDRGRLSLHRFYISMPIFGKIYHKAALGRFSHVLETLDRSGVPILESLKISASTLGNDVISREVDKAIEKVAQGRSIAVSLGEGSHFPRHMLKMMEVGEAAGSLDIMLHEVASLYDTEVDELLGKLTTMIEPILTVIMGAVILTLALAMFLPMWGMYEAF
ncbi:MAG: type II secretion system F family protein [Candidatus Neomarinimicrobiota bacterium]